MESAKKNIIINKLYNKLAEMNKHNCMTTIICIALLLPNNEISSAESMDKREICE